MIEWMPWVLFHVFVLGMLALDLGVFHRKAHVIHYKEALAWSWAFCIVSGFSIMGWRSCSLLSELKC